MPFPSFAWADVGVHLAFLMFVALAVYAQTLTGFALTLILLGLIGATNLFSLTDGVNAATIIGFSTASVFLYLRRPIKIERAIWPTLAASIVGIFAGTLLLTWLAGTAYQMLRMLLGICIVGCALLLWRTSKPLPVVSSTVSFAVTGGISGLLAGLFAAPGPPLVYLLYRQPFTLARIQESLFLIFGLGTVLRLAIVVPAGQFSWRALLLAVEALPVIWGVTYVAARRPPPFSAKLFKTIVCLLLVATGLSMIVTSLMVMR